MSYLRPDYLHIVSHDAYWYYARDPRAATQSLVQDNSRVVMTTTGNYYPATPGKYLLPDGDGYFAITPDQRISLCAASNS